MTRSVAAMSSVLLAYLVCVLSGVNRWAYIWLKSFYPGYAVVMWVVLALIMLLSSRRASKLHRSLLFFGASAGYLAGIVGYNLGPVVRDGSFVRSVSTIEADGVWRYIELSTFYPLILLSPLAGVMAFAAFGALFRSTKADRYFATVIGGVVLIAGWAFFLARGGVPPRW